MIANHRFLVLADGPRSPVDVLGAHCSTEDQALRFASQFHSDRDKARLLFSWVAHHISYDVARESSPGLHESGSHVCFETRSDGVVVNIKEEDSVRVVLQCRQALCLGYAVLLQHLCQRAGLACRLESGNTRSAADLRMSLVGHAWNSACGMLLDPTWAAGYVSKGRFFVRH